MVSVFLVCKDVIDFSRCNLNFLDAIVITHLLHHNHIVRAVDMHDNYIFEHTTQRVRKAFERMKLTLRISNYAV